MEDKRQLISILETNLARQLGWVQAADGRVSLVLPLSTAMLGLIAALVPKDICQWEVLPISFAVLSSCLLILSLIFVVFASFPRTTGPEGSLIFFAGISSNSLSEYKDKIQSLTEDGYINDLVEQSHRNAEIVTKKYYWVKKSLTCIFLSLPLWLVSIFLLYSLGN